MEETDYVSVYTNHYRPSMEPFVLFVKQQIWLEWTNSCGGLTIHEPSLPSHIECRMTL